MVGSRMCGEHGLEAETHCGWCSRPVCDRCIEEAHGHRLCSSCSSKLAKDKPLVERRPRDRAAVKNVDESLTEDRVRLAREELAARERKEKQRPRIRNVPDWPVLQ